MKIYKNCGRILISLAILGLFAVGASSAKAASIPNLSAVSVNGTSQVQVTVSGADSYAAVQFNYPAGSGNSSLGIGTTNGTGYFTTTLNGTSYNIPPNVPVYVTVDGQSSASIQWPNDTGSTSGTLTLSQSDVSLPIGQNVTVNASVSSGLSVSGDDNASVASAVVSGSQIVITAYSVGNANITVCATGVSCSTLFVTVQAASSGSPSVFFSQSTVTVPVGQSQTVTISGSGSFFLSSNLNSTIATAALNGSALTINGITAGDDSISVCSSENGISACNSVSVIVGGQSSSVSSSAAGSLSFSQTSTNLTVGQSQVISIYGGVAPYYISSNSAPQSVSAAINATAVDLAGVTAGQSSVTVCGSNGQCGTLYAYVTANGTVVSSPTGNSSQIPALSSFSVSSNDANNNFMGFGDVLTITFNVNQPIIASQVVVNGSSLTVSGAGSGPYTATYTVTGNEVLPLPVGIHFSNSTGGTNQEYFWVGNTTTGPTASGIAATTPSSSSASSADTFTEYLYVSSTGPQVTALQQRLTKDGLYSGPITGTFGALTQAAVKAYQAKHDLTQLGVVGPSTRGLLNEGI